MLTTMLLALAFTGGDLKDGGIIPPAQVWNKDGCHGRNHWPDLVWTGVPAKARSLALTVVDYDAPKPGGWVHWLVFEMRPTSRGWHHRAQKAFEGNNDFGTQGWGGPCPPSGQLHHYTVRLDALDIVDRFNASTTLSDYKRISRGHVLATATIVPVYKR